MAMKPTEEPVKVICPSWHFLPGPYWRDAKTCEHADSHKAQRKTWEAKWRR